MGIRTLLLVTSGKVRKESERFLGAWEHSGGESERTLSRLYMRFLIEAMNRTGGVLANNNAALPETVLYADTTLGDGAF